MTLAARPPVPPARARAFAREVQIGDLPNGFLEVLLGAYSGRSQENARRAKDELFGVQNSRKANVGRLAGLLDPALMGEKAAKEKARPE